MAYGLGNYCKPHKQYDLQFYMQVRSVLVRFDLVMFWSRHAWPGCMPLRVDLVVCALMFSSSQLSKQQNIYNSFANQYCLQRCNSIMECFSLSYWFRCLLWTMLRNIYFHQALKRTTNAAVFVGQMEVATTVNEVGGNSFSEPIANTQAGGFIGHQQPRARQYIGDKVNTISIII